jgi:hypothetical protein
MISAFAYCPERFHLAHVENWGPAREATSLGFGAALHKGLRPVAVNQSQESLAEGIKIFLKEFAKFDGLDEVRTLEKGEEILKAYIDQDRENGWSEVKTEISFAIDLLPTLTVCGKIDKFGLKDGTAAIQDWKTSTQPWNFVANPNHQATMYLLGAQTILGPEVQDFYFELIGVFKNSENGFRIIRATKENEARTESIFQVIHVQRSPKQIERFVKELELWSIQIEHCEILNTWPQTTENCNGKYGPCAFQSACMAGDGKEAVLEAMYRRVKWNPIEGKEELG